MAGKKIKIEIKGLHEDDEHILLEEFTSELEAICKALRNVDRVVTKKDKQTVEYRVVDLSHSSPATVTLEAHPIKTDEDYCDEVVDKFSAGLNSIVKKGEAPPEFDYQTLEAFREIGEKVPKKFSKLVVSTNGHSYKIPDDFQSRVKVIQGTDVTTQGSISGKIEAINIHKGTNKFRIYPSVGPEKIICHFKKVLVGKAVSAVNKNVTVFGSIKYKARSKYPHQIDVDKLEIHKTGKTFPKLSELKGIEPDITEGLSPEDFVRKIRDVE